MYGEAGTWRIKEVTVRFSTLSPPFPENKGPQGGTENGYLNGQLRVSEKALHLLSSFHSVACRGGGVVLLAAAAHNPRRQQTAPRPRPSLLRHQSGPERCCLLNPVSAHGLVASLRSNDIIHSPWYLPFGFPAQKPELSGFGKGHHWGRFASLWGQAPPTLN